MKTVAWLLLAALPASAQDWKKKVDQKKVDAAVDAGGKYLLSMAPGSKEYWDYDGKGMRFLELVLLTLLHSGYTEANEQVRDLLKKMLETPIERTYLASLQAMILVKLDPEKYQPRLAEIAQFLVDNQCKNGQWSYGEPVPPSKDVPTGEKKREDTATGGSGSGSSGGNQTPKDPPKTETRALKRVPIKKRGDGPPIGDNSNSQYAALGLRACHDANVRVPADVITKAKKWWEDSQNDDGGWSYYAKGQMNSHASMTAGAIGSIAIYNYIQSGGPGGGAAIDKGKKWIETNFTVKKNAKHAYETKHYFYYLYALERCGIFLNSDYFGKNDWYADGANHLLTIQGKSGEWGESLPDHCFAILFLRRATQPLRPPVATK